MSLIDDILWRLNIVDIVWEYIDLKKVWNNYKWLCPFHNEKTPSFVVSEEKQIFKCFWCWKWWNLISFVNEIENIEFYEALQVLSKKAWLEMNDYRKGKGSNQKDIDLKTRLVSINKTALNYFHKKVFEDANAMNYLKKRKLDKETIIKYKIWFSGNSSVDFIKYMQDKGFSEKELIDSTLARKSSTWSLYGFFSNRIIFPIFSSLWEVVAFSWRIFNGEKNTWKYINSAETPIYKKSSILYNYQNAKKTKEDFLIVCEWYMDVIWLSKLWYENSVASCWTALTEKHIQLMKRVSKNIVFAFDSDDAWFQASLRWTKTALSMDLYPFIYKISWWKDFDDIAAWWWSVDIIKDKKDSTEYIIDYLLKNFENKGPWEKQESLDQIFDILRQIWNFNIFWSYLESLWKKIRQDPNILYQQIKSKKTWKKTEIEDSWINENNQYMIPSLFYNDFYKKIFKDKGFESTIEDVKKLIKNLNQNKNILKKVFNLDLTSHEIEKILEKQLERENNLDWRDNLKKEKNTKSEIKKYLIKVLTDIFKDPKSEKKMELILIIQKLRG